MLLWLWNVKLRISICTWKSQKFKGYNYCPQWVIKYFHNLITSYIENESAHHLKVTRICTHAQMYLPFMGVTEYWPFVMNEELIQCLSNIPGFVSQLEGQMNSINLNLIKRLVIRAELFPEPIAHPDG